MHALINELSFLGQVKDRGQCACLIVDLMNIINVVSRQAGDANVYASRNLLEKHISKRFTVKDFIYDRNTDKSTMRGFIIIITRGPYFEDLLDNIDHECIINSNNDVTNSCIAAASHMSGFLISLRDSVIYDYTPVEVKYKEGTGDFQLIEIPNFIDSVNAAKFITGQAKGEITSWDIFWIRREALFPKLKFCECINDQLNRVNFRTYSSLVLRHLKCMNDYIEEVHVNERDYKMMGVEASVESKITLFHHGHKREFDCFDGIRRRFSWHSKQQGQNIRIHFYPPDGTTGDFHVGYIGKHLPTMSDPH
ncbi:MAG: hypothetical protein L7F77_06545 [Candidatus Magnetominusculus sp. LBB02]|nr:hypothetical protein [Candidatus Magnetominusculus sp. LBB02]